MPTPFSLAVKHLGIGYRRSYRPRAQVSPSRLRGVPGVSTLPGAAPVERDMLTRPPVPLVLEAEGVHPICCGPAPGGRPAGAHLGPGWVERLHPLPRGSRRPPQCLGTGDTLT